MANRINSIKKGAPELYSSPILKDGKLSYSLYDAGGNKVGNTLVDPGTDMSNASNMYFTKGSDGTYTMSDTPKANIFLNKETKNISIDAPKSFFESSYYKEQMKPILESHSQAYKLNENYKVSVMETNKDTGKQEEKQIGIEEWVSRANDGLKSYFDNIKKVKSFRNTLVETYGDKAKNLTDEQMGIIMQKPTSGIYIPDIVFSVSSFGDDFSLGNPLKKLKGKGYDNGAYSLKDFDEIYTRDNFGRTELMGLVATIDGALRASDWSGNEYYEDADGNQVYNRNSANEAAKLLAFREYIIANHPEGKWYQQFGDGIETLALDTMYYATRVVANLANDVQGALTGGQGKDVHNYIKGMDETMDYYNTASQLTIDSAKAMQFIGMIGGTLAGSYLVGKVGKAALRAGGSALGSSLGKVGAKLGLAVDDLISAAKLAPGSAAAEALTISSMAKIAGEMGAISRGAQIFLKFLNAGEKAVMASYMAKAYLNGHAGVNWAVNLLTDTIHDALLYDSTTLRDALEATDQETRDYWIGQLADNTKWWVGMGAAKGAFKFAGKTTLGKAADAVITPWVNKIAANIGERTKSFRDSMAGGDVVRKLESQLENAKVGTQKYNRIARKLEQEQWNNIVRNAKKELGNINLDWDGMKLAEDSMKKFQDLKTTVKALENGIDAYNRNIATKMDEMIRAQLDPSTGRMGYINPFLATANNNASKFYNNLVDLGKKYDLTPAKNSLISQDMIDYMVGRYQLGLMSSFAKSSSVNAADAQAAAEIITKNLDVLKQRLPDEIVMVIDDGIRGKVYQNWYKSQNEYGMSKGLLNRDKVTSYENNPIWRDNGYMPVVVELDSAGRFLEKTGRIDSVIEQDFESIRFRVAEGQHYQDPELVRQSRLKNMARAEVNAQIYKGYSGFGSNATNITKVTGEETEYVRKVNENKKTLEQEISSGIKGNFKEGVVNIPGTKGRKPVKNETIDQPTASTITASMSPDQTASFLVRQKKLPNKSAKLTDGVTAENYEAWYGGLNSSAQKYIKQQVGDDITFIAEPDGTVEKVSRPTFVVGADGVARKYSPEFERFKRAMENGGDDFEAGLQRAYLAGDKTFTKSSVMNEAARNLKNGKDAFYQGVLVAKVKGEMRNILKIDIDETVDSIYSLVREQVDNFIYGVMRNPGAKTAINTLAEASNGADEVGKYIALRELAKKGNLDEAKKAMHTVLDDELKPLKSKLTGDQIETIYKKADEIMDDVVRTELDNARSTASTINPEFTDAKDIYAKAKSLNEKIKGAEEAKNDDYIMYLDDEGRQVYAQVDPAFASLFNYRHSIETADASALAKVNAAMSKVFRYGTTSLNLSSFGNQLFRDFGNALYVGGAFQTIKANADNLVDVFGEDIVNQIKQFDTSGYEMEQIRALARSTGQTIEEAAVSRELMKGSAAAPSSTETTLYRRFMQEAYGDKTANQLTEMRNTLNELASKIDPDEILNGKRESYLRRRVYASSLNDAMRAGYNLEQSRVYAEFAMNNATTNFGRQLYHMQAIADSTPYFRAAINGTKSFWRMWSLDPVGITGRITGGLILPVMALTAYSLSSEENKKIYSNIPEYTKDGSLVFVFQGKPMSIPIPQEISNLVNPFRHFVEYLHDAQPNEFWELAMNDLLGIMPYDFQGFTAIDMDKMSGDPTFFDRVGRGVSRLFSQMAPVPARSAYMLASGIDPYSGKNLRDPKNNVIWSPETGDTEVMNYNQNTFARWFAETFKDTGISANLAEKVLSSLMGVTNANLLGDLAALFTEGGESFAASVATNVGGQISKPFTVGEYDLATAVWKREVSNLTIEKERILNSNEYKTIASQLSQATDPDERRKLIAKQSDLFSEFQQKVGDTVKRLASEYSGTMDRQKYAAVMNLLNYNSDSIYQPGTQSSSDIASQAYWEGRDAAIHTMWELGIRGTEDASIFGYLAKDRDTGQMVVKYTSPIAIMDMKNQWYNQDSLNAANISATLKRNGIKDAHDSVNKQLNSIRDGKSKLSKQDKANIEAVQINWNAQLAKTIAPYVAQMTPEAAINNTEVLNAIYPYIEVPNSWKTGYVGEHGNSKRAYYESWIRSMFSVNDPYKGQY